MQGLIKQREIKKITFLGNFTVPYCTEVHHAKTYEKLGIEVVRLQEGKATVQEIFEAMKDSQAFCWTHTHGWQTPGIENLLYTLKYIGKPSYGYHLDLWMGIERQKDLESDPFWNVEYFFSVDPEMVDYLNSKSNLPKAYFLPAGVFEDECYLAEPNREKYPHDIVFTGSNTYHKEWPYRNKLVTWLKETYGSRFGHYGSGGMPQLRGHELNVMYASAKIVIGDTLCPGFTKPGYLSDRIFEVTGRGGMIIHPYIKGMENLFLMEAPYNHSEQDSNAVDPCQVIAYTYDDFGELKTLIDLYTDLGWSQEREETRIAGHNRTKRDHTYTQRLTKLIRTLEYGIDID